MNFKLETIYTLFGLTGLFLILHVFWCLFIAYPISFEKSLKQGKAWVYVPIRWKGFYKFQIAIVTRLLILILSFLVSFLLIQVSPKKEISWLLFFLIICTFLIAKGTSFVMRLRFNQQEDCYYYLHDELKEKLESEGKDLTESAFKNLAAYQHHQFLHMADKSGHLIKSLNSQTQSLRKMRKSKSQNQVEIAA